MKNENDIKPNPIELESLRSELIEKTLSTSSNNLRVILYQKYFDSILTLNNPNFEEAFLKEFLDDYISFICKFEMWGTEPEITKKLLEQLKIVSRLKVAAENLTKLNSEIDRIKKQFEKLNLILDGKEYDDGETHKAFFPLIDKDAPEGFYGIIESVTIRISKAVDNEKFIIVPSEKEIEKKILEQCKKSWELSLNLSSEYVKKPFKHHEVIIIFDKKQGFYEGNSLGIALTLSFLEQILKFYNPAYIINIKEQSAFTGGVTETGEVLYTSEEIIKRKVAAIFFSEINTFVFPKCEETYAYFALTQLKKSYPNRKLKLIPVEDINDVLNRRDVVDIKKQKLIVRSGKFVKKNWISAVVTILLAILFGYLFVMDFDDNPAILTPDGSTMFVKNKNGKILWTKLVSVDTVKLNSENPYSEVSKIIDINKDGKNEVLLLREIDKKTLTLKDHSQISCYDKYGKIIWQYSFEDNVSSNREVLNDDYSIYLIDTLSLNSVKSLFLIASNVPSFSSAFFRIDLLTGKRLPGTFWSSGIIANGFIKDIDNDNQREMLGLGYDNGYENLVLFSYEIDTLTKVRPTTEEYLIQNYPISEMKAYLRFPKIDYDNYVQKRTSFIYYNTLENDNKNKEYKFAIRDPFNSQDALLSYEINYDFKNIDITINSGFRVTRDTLVAHGKLNQPYTDTEAYKKIIKNNILYWKNGKWVKKNELD